VPGLTGPARGADDPGFRPPDRRIARCEHTVTRRLKQNARCLDGCTFVAAKATIFRGRPFDDERCEAACGAALVRAGDALFARGICPPCITRLSPATVAMLTEQASNAGTGQVACAGTIPLGGDDAGFVPPDRATGRCELAAGRSVSRLDQVLLTCQMRTARAAFAEKAFDEDACEEAAARRYDATIARLHGCPACLQPTALKTQLRLNADAAAGIIYCASPSGAFLGAD
jgi:hypothetical protein